MHDAPILAVEKRAFIQALRSLRISARARQNDEALIYYNDELLCIRLLDMVVEVPAKGTWVGRVRVNARTLIPLVTFPPDPDPLPLTFSEGRFFIAGWSVNAQWQPAVSGVVEVPANPTCMDLLSLESRYTFEELVDAGLDESINSARATLRTCLGDAARALEPTGLTLKDLEELVSQKLTSR